jgi:hypothetical protein
VNHTTTTGPHPEPDPYRLYWQLTEGPQLVEVGGRSYLFQFHGPALGNLGSFLEVARDDGVAHRFGPGQNSEAVWRAFSHLRKGWEEQPFPVYREVTEQDEYETPIYLERKNF